MPAGTRDIAAAITDTIIAKLEAGTVPWQRPWSVTGEGGRPLRHEGTPYLGINSVWLWVMADFLDFRSRYWMTARQAEELGGHVRRDAQPSFSVYSSTFRKRGQPNLEGISADKLIRFLRSYTVFNADEIEGLPSYFYPRPAPPTPTLLSARQDRIDAFFAAIPSRVRRGGDRAFFSYTFDYIQMPHAGSFKSADAHASILAHEHAHWTGHSSRLDRTFGKKFGDKAYCVEELVAELTGAMVCSDLGLPSEIHDSHANYVADWLRVLRADKSAIFVAATKAEQAFAYLRAFSDEAATRDAVKLAA
ncbi:ArdC family protein [Sphingomonas sp. BK069]|uniref:ArdC family protein n=1 Tax=Sphingomonas sp. BK069 TaxID=2586979 RepID=UPI0016084EC0|nr:zincin-like metallopeptidase domain-containing protein [Sphingomonas sp. BK069]MBB3350083.1 antirestriction protein ArdC [Sphingomonas sp. BK069]